MLGFFSFLRMDRKAKGTRGERELIKFFNEIGSWCAIRSAGSGSSRYPSPDILAGNALRRVAVECKVTKENKKYFPLSEVEQLKFFSRIFGAESWVAVKFSNEPWYFLTLEDLQESGQSFVVSVELARRKGLTKEELVGLSSLTREQPLDTQY